MWNTHRNILVVPVALLILYPAVSLAAEGAWTTKADMPTARFGLSTSVVDGKIYAIGGATGPQKDLQTVEEYDPATDSWLKKADMPTTRCWHSASAVNGKIYVIGGYAAGALSGMVEEYDPATDTWTRKADMPTPRWVFATSVVNGKIYAMGGANDLVESFAIVEEYDPATDTWARKADMPTKSFALSTSAVNGKIYAIGGASAWQVFVRTVEEYDPATDAWTHRADIPTPRWWLSTSTVNRKVIYAIGGCVDVHGITFSTVEAYDPQTDSWTEKADIPTPRKALATSVVDGKIYAVGGSAVPHWDACVSTVEQYDATSRIVDYNGDEKADFKDFCILAQYWHQDQSPFVEHKLDHKDLAALADSWLEEVLPVNLIAYWNLDEADGPVAHDSANDHDGTLHNSPTWQPTNGKLGGAVQFDGVDDYISTSLVLNPADGEFSVFAWVKGGAPGQVIISQSGGANWLLADPADGKLITELKGTGRFDGPLYSQNVITDGAWHRVGLTWDGSNRILYVDDVEVAKDTQTSLAGSTGGLYFGAGKIPVPPSLWFGLLDDIRIYDRAVTP